VIVRCEGSPRFLWAFYQAIFTKVFILYSSRRVPGFPGLVPAPLSIPKNTKRNERHCLLNAIIHISLRILFCPRFLRPWDHCLYLFLLLINITGWSCLSKTSIVIAITQNFAFKTENRSWMPSWSADGARF
jgi:hypothetical protein